MMVLIQISEFFFFLVASSWIRTRIRIWNPHLECGLRMRIQETKIMRIHADVDADPQHC
jgi:hypothetical protein